MSCKGRIDLSELSDHVSERKPNERAAAHDWGSVAALVYAASFLTTGQRVAIRMVAQELQSTEYNESGSIAG